MLGLVEVIINLACYHTTVAHRQHGSSGVRYSPSRRSLAGPLYHHMAVAVCCAAEDARPVPILL
jgi:hypothetical protein